LACRPFENHFSSPFFFLGETHESALLKLRYAIENRLGVGVLCGGIGIGKSAVATELSHELDSSCGPVVHVLFPQMPAAEFLAYLASKLGGGEAPADSRNGMDRILQRIEGLLRGFAQNGRRPTIVIDDAHLIDNVRVWECLQLLLNFQHDAGCDFSLILAGGLSLMGRLERTPQLNDRVAVFSVTSRTAWRSPEQNARSSTAARSTPCASARVVCPVGSIAWPTWRSSWAMPMS
jgi:general secretion pathway protein A